MSSRALRIAEGRDRRAVIVGIFLAPFVQEPREARAIRAGAIEDDAVGRPELLSHAAQFTLAGARSRVRLVNCASSVEPSSP